MEERKPQEALEVIRGPWVKAATKPAMAAAAAAVITVEALPMETMEEGAVLRTSEE